MWDDLESMCRAIKDGLDVDLDEIRALLRRAQYRIEDLENLLEAAVIPGAAVLAALHRDD